MTNKLDKLIGNDELLTYICLILAILNTFLISMIITDSKDNFSIYLFLLFEALFLIFIVYFLLKKKDVYSKDDDIKYDWYFYLRVSIIILVFFNFALYIYNISKDPSINPKKTGGGPAFSTSRSNKVAPAAPAARVDNKIALKTHMLQNKLKPLIREYSEGLEKIKSTMNNQDSNKITENSKLVESIAPLRQQIEKINAELEKLQGESTVTTASRASRASRATASNKVLPDPFPYQEPVSNEKLTLTIKDIMSMKELTAAERTALWGKQNKNKK
jgi:hypothetical protein